MTKDERLEAALEWYRQRTAQQLTEAAGQGARLHLSERGIDQAQIVRWEIGYAADTIGSLAAAARDAGFSHRELIDAGIAATNTSQTQLQGRFERRLTMPIRNSGGQLCGFAARALRENSSKYLNSPNGGLFEKNKLLYGLDKAKAAIEQSGQAIIVEGYFDAIWLHQHGFAQTVAVMGSSLGSEQLRLLEECGARRLTLLFDGDRAGEQATARALETCLEMSVSYGVLGSQDPQGLSDKKTISRVLEHSRDRFEFALRHKARSSSWEAVGGQGDQPAKFRAVNSQPGTKEQR